MINIEPILTMFKILNLHLNKMSLVVSIIAIVVAVMTMSYTIFLAYKVYDNEDYVVAQLKHLVNQIDRINAIEFRVDEKQSQRLTELEAAKAAEAAQAAQAAQAAKTIKK